MLFQAWQYKEALTVLNTHPELKARERTPETYVYGNFISYDPDVGYTVIHPKYQAHPQVLWFGNVTELLKWLTRTYH